SHDEPEDSSAGDCDHRCFCQHRLSRNGLSGETGDRSSINMVECSATLLIPVQQALTPRYIGDPLGSRPRILPFMMANQQLVAVWNSGQIGFWPAKMRSMRALTSFT